MTDPARFRRPLARLSRAAVVAFALATAGAGHADLVTYEYTGPSFTSFETPDTAFSFTSSDSLTGTMTVDVPAGGGSVGTGAITALSFTTTYNGGADQFTLSLSGGATYFAGGNQFIDFDASGNMTGWSLALRQDVVGTGSAVEILGTETTTVVYGRASFSQISDDSGVYRGATNRVSQGGDPGTWSVATAAIPEPSAALFGGLLTMGLAAMRRRRV